MADDNELTQHEHEKSHRFERDIEHASPGSAIEAMGESGPTYPSALLGDTKLSGRGNAPVRSALIKQLQRTYGNRSIQRYLQRSRGSTATTPDEDLGQRIDAKLGSGSSLDAPVQRQLEDGLGVGLSNVRIHTDSEADQMSRSVDAVAFTTGQDIFFRDGAYNPGSTDGLRLLAHEAAHTIQQSAGPVAGTASSGGVAISDPSDSFEQAAERAADNFVSGASKSHGGLSTATPSVQRQVDAPVEDEQKKKPEEEQLVPMTAVQGKFIQRDTPTANPPPASGGSPSASSTPTSDNIDTVWKIDYYYKPEAKAAQSKAPHRDENTALGVKQLVVNPSGGDTKTFTGMNVNMSGAAVLGTMSHPKGAGGTVSGSVEYGGKPDVHVTLTVTDKPATKKDADAAEAKRKIAEAHANKMLQTHLKEHADVWGADYPGIEQQLKGQLTGKEFEGFDLDVKLSHTPKSPTKVTLDTTSYPTPVVRGNRATMTAKVAVPILDNTVVAGGGTTTTQQVSWEDTATHKEATQEQVKELEEATKSVTTAFDSAWSSMSERATEKLMSSETWHEDKTDIGIGGKLGGEINTGAELDIPLPIEIPVKLGAKTSIKASGEIHGDAKWTKTEGDKDRTETKTSRKHQLTSSMKSSFSQTATSKMATEYTASVAKEKGLQQKTAASTTKTTNSTSSVTTVAAQTRDPILTVTPE